MNEHLLCMSGRTPDPYFSSVVLLVGNENGTHGTSSFIDQSNSGKTVTANGNVAWSNVTAPTGLLTSIAMDGTGDFLSLADSADWTFGTGDWTAEGYVRFTSTIGTLIGQYATLTANASLWCIMNNGGDPNAYFEWTTDGTTNNFQAFSWAPLTDTWYHVAFCRASGTLRVFVNGVQIGSNLSNNVSYFDSNNPMYVGHNAAASTWDTNGYMAAVRVTKGVARYTSSFTPPTLPLPNS